MIFPARLVSGVVFFFISISSLAMKLQMIIPAGYLQVVGRLDAFQKRKKIGNKTRLLNIERPGGLRLLVGWTEEKYRVRGMHLTWWIWWTVEGGWFRCFHYGGCRANGGVHTGNSPHSCSRLFSFLCQWITSIDLHLKISAIIIYFHAEAQCWRWPIAAMLYFLVDFV